MSDIIPTRLPLSHLVDDLLWKIFVKSEAKTVGRCRTLNKTWRFKLSTTLFVKQNFKKNKDRNQSLIIGVGYPPSDSNSQWFVMADVEHGHQLQLNISANINQFGYYSIVGTDNENLCIRYCQGGLNSSLMILNPLTQYVNYVSDEAKRHCCHAVNLYAFGYLVDSIKYHIIYVYKKYFSERHISSMLYNSFEADWKHSGTFISDVLKVGPKSIVDKGVVYWIEWQGVGYAEPTSILFFSLQQRIFNEAKIPEQAKSTYHCSMGTSTLLGLFLSGSLAALEMMYFFRKKC